MPTLALCTICLRPVKGVRDASTAEAAISIKMTTGSIHGATADLVTIERDYVCAECHEWWSALGAHVRAVIEERRARFEEITRELTAISIVDAGQYVPLLGAVTEEEEEIVRRIAARQSEIAVSHALSGDAEVVAKRLGAAKVARLRGPAPESLGDGGDGEGSS